MKCGSATRVVGIFDAVACDLDAGHNGRHRGYMAQVDEPVFWGVDAPTTVDPKVYELAGDFLDDLCSEDPIASRPMSEEQYDALNQRLAAAMQRAIEDECASIREELLP